MNLPTSYILLRQPGRYAEVLAVIHGRAFQLFVGNRWDARDYLGRLHGSIFYCGLPVYNQKRTRRGAPPVFVQIPEAELRGA